MYKINYRGSALSGEKKNMNFKQISQKNIDDIIKLDDRFGSPWSRGLYSDRLQMFPDLAYGAFSNNKMVGFILGKRDMSGNVTISRVVVDRKHEGKGIGGNLVDILTKKVHDNAQRVVSTVRESNIRSINLHKGRGFDMLPEFHTYSDGERGIKFLKRL